VKDFDTLLARIDDGLARGLIDQRAAAHYLGAHLSRRLYCSRVALWTFRQAPGRADITRLGGYDALLDRPLGEIVTLRIEAPSAWLGELLGRGGYASSNAAGDRRLIAQRDDYLAPGRVGALLQAAIVTEGRACGFVGCEQVGTARAWTPADAALLRQVADAVSQRRARRLVLASARGGCLPRVSRCVGDGLCCAPQALET
jgi:GAF domain-containing protein